MADPQFAVEPRGSDLVAVCFTAMASRCELLLRASHLTAARELGECAAQEAWRIEEKFSRHKNGSFMARLHARRGAAVQVDRETALLLNFAQHCHRISDGLFDVTSGILRRCEPDEVRQLLSLVGFEKIFWEAPIIELPIGMELDLCGIDRQYAVDRAFELLAMRSKGPFLLNFGGDMRASGPPPLGCWQIAVPGTTLNIERGALATCGDPTTLPINPKTGAPVRYAPRSITVAADSCAEAGMLSMLALFQGARARAFLSEQGVKYWLLD